MTAIDIAASVSSGSTSAVAVLEEHLARIDALEPEIHAFNVMLWRAAAREQWGALFDFLETHMHGTSAAAPAEAPHYVSLAETFAE